MENKKNIVTLNLSWPMVFFVVFMTLKLCNVIDWSWWWVTAPLWIPLSIGILVLLTYIVLLFISEITR